MNVYVITYWIDYENEPVVAVCASEERANQYIHDDLKRYADELEKMGYSVADIKKYTEQRRGLYTIEEEELLE